MLSRLFRSKALVALVVPVLTVGFAFAGGPDCHKATEQAGKGAHCHMLSKQVAKSFELTEDGAVVTLKGETEKAVGHIKDHFAQHEKGEECEGCPLGIEAVDAQFELTDDGGIIRVKASTPDAVKAVQEWAKAPAGQCCGAASDKA
jgi:TusA-related sulfurtransferase